MLRLGTNSTSPNHGSGSNSGSNMTDLALSNTNSSRFIVPTTDSTYNSSSTDTLNALCNTCPNSVGICCPPTVDCDGEDGKCPLYALENSHNTLNGYLIAQVMNSSAPVAGRKKVRALPKPKNGVMRDLAEMENVDSGYGKGHDHNKKHKLPKKAHRRQF